MNNAYLFDIIINNILPIYLVVYCILSLFFKPDKLRIYCGVFAFCGPTNLSKGIYAMILANIKLIGLQNDSRGGDNAGILINNEVIHTKGLEWKFSELLQKNTLENPNPEYSTVIIGHCRKGSVGGRDHKNAHPFEIYQNDNENDFFMSGVHNGTVSNWKELAENYAIDPALVDNDSKVMLTILSRQRNLQRKKPVFRVLEQYKGFGVFIWYFVDEPNTMYVFKGAGKTSEFNQTIYEERPLYFYECPITKGVYFSSLEEPLKMIAINKDKVDRLGSNVVYKITEGKFIKEDEVKIDRSKVINYTVSNVTTYGHVNKRNKHQHGQTNMYESCVDDESCYEGMLGGGAWRDTYDNAKTVGVVDKIFHASSASKKEEEKTETKQIQTKIDVTNIVPKELPSFVTSVFDHPSNKSLSTLAKEGLIYRSAGLYYYKGKLMTGTFMLEKFTYKAYDKLDDEFLQKELKEKPYNYDTKHFFKGYMLKDIVSLNTIQTAISTAEKNNLDWQADKTDDYLSHFCTQPVPGLFDKNVYYMTGIKANFRCEKPPYSENKTYVFEHGSLKYVVSLKNPEKEVKVTSLIIDPKELEKAASELGIPYQRTREETIQNAITISSKEKEKEIIPEQKKDDIISVEDGYLIDAGEEEVVRYYQEFCEMCKEQGELMKPFIEKGLLKETDFLSGVFNAWFTDTLQDCLISPGGGKDNSPYFKKSGSELIYLGLKKEDVEEFNVF